MNVWFEYTVEFLGKKISYPGFPVQIPTSSTNNTATMCREKELLLPYKPNPSFIAMRTSSLSSMESPKLTKEYSSVCRTQNKGPCHYHQLRFMKLLGIDLLALRPWKYSQRCRCMEGMPELKTSQSTRCWLVPLLAYCPGCLAAMMAVSTAAVRSRPAAAALVVRLLGREPSVDFLGWLRSASGSSLRRRAGLRLAVADVLSSLRGDASVRRAASSHIHHASNSKVQQTGAEQLPSRGLQGHHGVQTTGIAGKQGTTNSEPTVKFQAPAALLCNDTVGSVSMASRQAGDDQQRADCEVPSSGGPSMQRHRWECFHGLKASSSILRSFVNRS